MTNPTKDVRRADLRRRLEITRGDLANADQQVEKWKATRQLHSREIKELEREISALDAEDRNPRAGPSSAVPDAINYMEQEFDWSGQLRSKLKKIFGIDDFRLCQKGCVTHFRLNVSPGVYAPPVAFVTQTFTKDISSVSCQREGGRV